MKIQIVKEWSDNKNAITHTENVGNVHEVFGSIGLWLEVMYIDTEVQFWHTDGEWKTGWMKDNSAYLRYRAIKLDVVRI